MNEVQYAIDKMSRRRGKPIYAVESVAFNIRVTFGLADGTFILPSLAFGFYYFRRINFLRGNADVTGVAKLTFTTNSAQASAGNIIMQVPAAASTYFDLANIEFDSLQYNLGSHSAGDFVVLGELYKITYE